MPAMMRTISFLALTGVAFTGSLVAAGFAPALAADKKPTLIATLKNWSAYSWKTPDGKVCYAMAKAASTSPEKVKRDPAYIMINNWPGRKSTGEIQVVPGYLYDENVPIKVSVGKLSVDFFAKNDGGAGSAWIKDTADEPKLLDAMRKGSRLTVTAAARKGGKTQDTYSLAGLGEMVDKARNACGK